jgi:anaerobic carbon-monoxide dehydrogenase iron sulfur subunit
LRANKNRDKRETIVRRIVAKEEHCMGCGLCEVYCTVQHSKTKDLVKAYNNEKPKPISRLRLELNKPISFAIQCRNCEEAPCVTACLSGAMRKNEETGLVTHESEKCIGCWTCIMVCPYSAIRMDIDGKVVAKCDLCNGLEVPACVASCPNGALEIREVAR